MAKEMLKIAADRDRLNGELSSVNLALQHAIYDIGGMHHWAADQFAQMQLAGMNLRNIHHQMSADGQPIMVVQQPYQPQPAPYGDFAGESEDFQIFFKDDGIIGWFGGNEF